MLTNWIRRRIRFRPTLIDAYVLTEVASPFIGGIAFFLFVFLMFQALRLADFFIVHGIPGAILLKMTSLLIVSFLPTSIPLSFLIGVLVAFGRLSADSELVAMKANGMSLFRLSFPVLGLSVMVSIVSILLNLEWVPWADRTFKNMLVRVGNTKVVSSLREGSFTSGFYDLLLYADKVDPKTNQMKKVFLYDEREPKNPMVVVAKEGRIVQVDRDSEIGGSAVLELKTGDIHRNDTETETYQKINFKDYRLYLAVEEGQGEGALKPRMLSHHELLDRISRAEREKNDDEYKDFRTEYWRRVATALTPLIFVFFGIGFGTVRTRAVRAGATLIAFLVIVAYWGLQAFATVLSKKGILPPPLAMQLPNLVMTIFGIYGFRTASW